MAHQDTRFLTPKETFKNLNGTQLHRDLTKFKESVNNVSNRALVVLRGLPGSGKGEIAKQFPDADVFNVFDYLPVDKDDKTVCDMANLKLAHLKMRKQIMKLLKDPKFKGTIVVNAPHIYLWELKFYRAQAWQYKVSLIIYEARTLFSKESEERAKQLADININEKIVELRKWLDTQKERGHLLDTQKRLVQLLHCPNPGEKLNMKDKTSSFCPTVLLNIQLAAWLSHKCEQDVFMDIVWHFIQEWQEITNDESLWKNTTPKWGW